MKFRAHDTFFIRKGWLSKGMKAVHNCPDLFVSKKEYWDSVQTWSRHCATGYPQLA